MNPAILDAHRARAKAATAKTADSAAKTDLNVIASPRQEFTPRSRGAEKLFDRTSLRREEAAAAKRLFELADRDQSGEVDLPEFIALLEVVADQFGLLDEDGAVAFEDHFRKADTDRSNSVNLHEFAVFVAELLDAMPHTHEQRAAELGRACTRVEKKMTGR
jgi:hypothetical protein